MESISLAANIQRNGRFFVYINNDLQNNNLQEKTSIYKEYMILYNYNKYIKMYR